MPRNGAGVYSFPPNTEAIPNEVIESAKYNSRADDVAADLNAPRPVVAGGTGADNGDDALTNLGLVFPLPIERGGTGADEAEDARENLGLGDVAVEDVLPVAKGGTGVDTEAEVRGLFGGGVKTLVAKSDDWTVLATDLATRFSYRGSNTRTATLPPVADCVNGQIFEFAAARAGTLRIVPSGTDTIDGGAMTICAPGQTCEVIRDGDRFLLSKRPRMPFIAHKRHIANASGGDSSDDETTTVDLNTQVVNYIGGAAINTSTGRISLPAGEYLARGWAFAYIPSAHKIWLFNVTDSSSIANGTGSTEFHSFDSDVAGRSSVECWFRLDTAADIEMRHRVQWGWEDGYGKPSGFADRPEVYAALFIEKIG